VIDDVRLACPCHHVTPCDPRCTCVNRLCPKTVALERVLGHDDDLPENPQK